MKILVAVDGSPITRRMLAYLAAHDEWLGAKHEYTLLYAVAPVPARASVVIDRSALRAYYEQEAERVFKPLRTFFARQGLQASFVSKVGAAAEEIAGVAHAGKYDLLLMGSHGHGRVANLVLGSVAMRVLATCRTPVLLVR